MPFAAIEEYVAARGGSLSRAKWTYMLSGAGRRNRDSGLLSLLAGFFEVAAVHGNANASLIAGYGYTGILIAFLARQNPLAIPPVAFLLGGIEASSGLIQRRMHLPDATILLLEGLLFLLVLMGETLYGRFKVFSPHLWGEKRAVSGRTVP